MTHPLRVATRGSRLALRQVELIGERPEVDVEPVIVSTLGDRLTDVPLRNIAGRAAFAGDVRTALAEGAADLAVHSAKDLPPVDDPRFAIAFPPRADARDALVGATLAEIPPGGSVATGAPRRRALLTALRPDIHLAELRGNIDTRLAKGTGFYAIVVAAAALKRLDITSERRIQYLPVDEFVPQVGQGALAVEARADDHDSRRFRHALDHPATSTAVTAERAFLATLGGDCDLPAGAHAIVDATGHIELHAFLAHDGHLRRCHLTGTDPAALGRTAATQLDPRVSPAASQTAGTVA